MSDVSIDARVFDAALEAWRAKSKKAIYQRDFAAWLWDVCGERLYKRMDEISYDVLLGDISQTLIKSANGTGKDLALDTPILTANRGWTTMGDIQVGDTVFDERGKPTAVTFKSDVMHNPCYRVVFDDGSEFIAGEDHEWNTLTLSARSNAKNTYNDWRDAWHATKTVNTKDIATSLRRHAWNHLVPLAGPLQRPEAQLPLHPYALGAWLGDGTSIRAEITCDYAADGYVIDHLNALGYPMRHCKVAEGYGWPYRWVAENDTTLNSRRTSGFMVGLRAAGVVRNKHIPEAYLNASVGQRIELVRGLMDTDGWADKRGSQANFGNSNERLVRDFCEVLTSLGVRYAVSSKIPKGGSRAWSVGFRSWFDPFTPGQRKSRIYTSASARQASRSTGRTVVSVERTLTVPTACIAVASESHLYLAGRNLVPTHNTYIAARWVAWWVTAFDPRDSLVIITGPRLQQVEYGVFANLKRLYGDVEARRGTGREPLAHEKNAEFEQWPGWINEQNEWIMNTGSGNEALALAAVPSAHEAAARLVGLRKPGGRNLIIADEAGGLHEGVWDATMALQTAGGSRGGYIGNPVSRGDGFFQRFEDLTKFGAEYNRHTISAYDTPALTGEIVYPDDPERDALLKTHGLVSRSWVASMERIFVDAPEEARYEEIDPLTGETLVRVDHRHPSAKIDASFRVRVLGEFADEADSAFFSQRAIDVAYATDLTARGDDAEVPLFLGVDVARFGSDESMVFTNRGGQVRYLASWSKADTTETAKRVHELAMAHDARQVRIDATGIGGGVVDALTNPLNDDKFGPLELRPYVIIRIDGGVKSPEPAKYLNARAFNHHQVREMMFNGLLDLDPGDKELWKQMVALTYRFTPRGALQITPKDEMRSKMKSKNASGSAGSPDRLDAMIYAAVNLDWLTERNGQPQIGDVVLLDPWSMLKQSRLDPNYPL